MGGEQQSIGMAEVRSALGWWLDAGVDVAVQEQPRNWLKPAPPPPAAAVPPPAQPSNLRQPTRESLAELQEWLAESAQLPLAGPGSRRVLPHGPENAAVMLLSDAPTMQDVTAGQPIGGESWELATRMLAAIGISPDDAYSASLSCFHAPGMKLGPAEREQCAEIARQHIRLVKPRRLILFGDGACLALLGKRVLEARGHIHKVEGVRTIATFHPRNLVKQTSNKSLAWKDLLLLMEGEA